MKKMCVIAVIAVMLANSSAATAHNAIDNGDFENGTKGFGICYSGRNDTVMPSLDENFNISLDGVALEFIPGETLGEKASVSPMSDGFAYQGIYSKTSLSVKADSEYTASVDLLASGEGAKMRFVVTCGNKAVSVSPEFEVESGKWCNNTFNWCAESDMSDVRIRIAFYNIKFRESIYVDNFVFDEQIISNKSWESINKEIINENGKIVFYANQSEENGITCTASAGKFENGKTYALSFDAKTDAKKAYLSVYCGNARKDFILFENETSKIMLPFEAGTDKTFKIIGFAEDGSSITIENAKVVDEYMIINTEEKNGQISVSGNLRKGNENKVINIRVGDLLQRTVITDGNGRYTMKATLPDIGKPRMNVKIAIDNINGYADINDELTADCVILNQTYAGDIALQVSGKSKDEISDIITDDVLDNLGLSALPIVRTADKDEIFDAVSKKSIEGGNELINAIIIASAHSSLSSKSQTLCNVTDEYGSLLNANESMAYKDIYSKLTDKESIDELFEKCEHKIIDKESYLFALAETIIRHEMKSLTNYSSQIAVLQKYANELGLDFTEYLKLSSEKRYSVATKWLENINSVTDYTTLQASLDTLVIEAEQNNSESGGNGGGGGSKTSGGGGLSIDTSMTGKAEYRFDDLENYTWAQDAIYKLVDMGVISKADNKKFNPGANVTRAEMAKMATIIAKISLYDGNDEKFVDVKAENWYYKYVMALFSNGIVNGISDSEFGSDSPITRQDICVILSRILNDKITVETQSFIDFDAVSDYAVDAVNLMKQEGIVNGFEDGSFRPHEYASRAEIANMLSNMLSK